MQPVKITAHSQQPQGRPFHYLANADDGFAIEPVGHMPDYQGEQEHG
jgi:hypothetical protein